MRNSNPAVKVSPDTDKPDIRDMSAYDRAADCLREAERELAAKIDELAGRLGPVLCRRDIDKPPMDEMKGKQGLSSPAVEGLEYTARTIRGHTERISELILLLEI